MARRRWRVVDPELWLIFTRHGTEIQRYPAILDHLSPFKKSLAPGAVGGRKPGTYKWYEIQDNIAYWREFERPKILYQEIATYQAFAWDGSGSYTNNKTFLIPEPTKLLLAVLNSPPCWWFLGQTASKLQGGAFAMQTPYVGQVPIPPATTAERSAIEGLVDKCLAARGQNCAAWQSEINDRVYRLYGLTKEEIKMVEEATNSHPSHPPAANGTE